MALRSALLPHTRFSAERHSDHTVQSSATWRTARGRCTFTATSSPLHVLALYTCPNDAAAMGAAVISANSGAASGSTHVAVDACPGASGPGCRRSSAMTRYATSSSNGTLFCCGVELTSGRGAQSKGVSRGAGSRKASRRVGIETEKVLKE
jgi:hypothetical protein